MSTIDSGKTKVIAHIDDAKGWLDEAREEYLQSNRIQGELNLNLAQAEVKYAWELSRNQNVIPNNQPLVLKRPNYYYRAAVAASIVILLGLASMLYFGARPEKPGSLVAKVRHEKHQATEAVLPVKQPELTKNELGIASTVSEVESGKKAGPSQAQIKRELQLEQGRKDSPPNPPVKTVKTEVVAAGKMSVPKKPLVPREKEPANSATTNKVVPVSNAEKGSRTPGANAIVLENVPEREAREATGVQTQTKPAAISLVIDEEALTKEASYSLRNGK